MPSNSLFAFAAEAGVSENMPRAAARYYLEYTKNPPIARERGENFVNKGKGPGETGAWGERLDQKTGTTATP